MTRTYSHSSIIWKSKSRVSAESCSLWKLCRKFPPCIFLDTGDLLAISGPWFVVLSPQFSVFPRCPLCIPYIDLFVDTTASPNDLILANYIHCPCFQIRSQSEFLWVRTSSILACRKYNFLKTLSFIPSFQSPLKHLTHGMLAFMQASDTPAPSCSNMNILYSKLLKTSDANQWPRGVWRMRASGLPSRNWCGGGGSHL